MISNLVKTFLDLGDATSRNLEFSHRRDVYVSYGEETITEHNLLEIRRRHSDRVHLDTFSKNEEAQNGADWEWHIVGNRWTLKMRVQAKRARYKGTLQIKYKQQRELLLDKAEFANMKPIYCFYCTEPQRSIWKQSNQEECHTGCLLADANDVPETTKRLCEIERKCIPWHYLFERAEFFSRSKSGKLHTVRVGRTGDYSDANREAGVRPWDAPTVADLNGEGDGDFDLTGVHETNDEDLNRINPSQADPMQICTRRIHRTLVIDVRDRE